jgi:hypothetical protein
MTYANDANGPKHTGKGSGDNNLQLFVEIENRWDEKGHIKTKYTRDVPVGGQVLLYYGDLYWKAVRGETSSMFSGDDSANPAYDPNGQSALLLWLCTHL